MRVRRKSKGGLSVKSRLRSFSTTQTGEPTSRSAYPIFSVGEITSRPTRGQRHANLALIALAHRSWARH
jgi:hypothetical protein